MIGIVLVSHGPLAEGLKGAAEMIVGPQECFLAIGMDPAAELDRLRAQIEAAVAEVASDSMGALVLVDLMGGSPANASAYLAAGGTPVICGASLPMLLESTDITRTCQHNGTGEHCAASRKGGGHQSYTVTGSVNR